MLDVHAPHEKIHGLGDFMLHLLTITVGLLIALGLEASVEGLHHRHQRIEAEATIREELQQNRTSLKKMQAGIASEQTALQHELAVLEDLREGKQDDLANIDLTFNVEPLQSAGWHTASGTGALSYMPYATVQGFSEVYQLQDDFEHAAAVAFAQFETVFSYITAPDRHALVYPKAPDVESAIRDLHLAQADLRSMQDVGRGTMHDYDSVLK
jgi:hypothetical protein